MNLLDQTKREEGCVLHPYRDTLGFLTIGWGRLIDPEKGGGISQAEADFMLANDLAKAAAAVDKALPWAARLNEPRKAVLIGMAFQMGVAGLLGFRRMLAAARDEHWATAAEEIRTSDWAKQTAPRAKRMAAQLETGFWN